MQFATVALAALATVGGANALAIRQSTPFEGTNLTAAPVSEQFTVTFTVFGQGMSANLVANGTGGPLLLEAKRLSAYPGTPAYFNSTQPANSTSTYKALNFVTSNGVYGAVAPNVGDSYGLARPVLAERNTQQFAWSEYNGSITHELYAAPNGFYYCKGTLLDGTTNFFLSFGDYNFTGTGSLPTGCNTTEVFINYNVEGGLQPNSTV